MAQLAGKVVRIDAEAITVFRVGTSYFPSTGENAEYFEAYLHTGDEFYLDKLEGELELS